MRVFFYLIFALFFTISKIFPVNDKKVVYIKTHDKGLDGNIGAVYLHLTEKELVNKHIFITREDYEFSRSNTLLSIKRLLSFFMKKSFHLATAKTVFLDNVFLPAAFFYYKKNVNVIQLWHGCGAIKKFGQDANIGLLRKLEKSANQTYTHLIVNSLSISKQYESAFNVKRGVIHPIGVPRTDFFFEEEMLNEHRRQFYVEFPELIGKKIILYAPTFRDSEIKNPKVMLDFKVLEEKLWDEYIFVLKLHPFIANNYQENNSKFVLNLSHYHNLNTLLTVADILITDYSSIIFEYSLMQKPMIFYPYDLQEFITKSRGLYFDYEKFVPGPIAFNTNELIEYIIKKEGFNNKLLQFKNTYFDYDDGKSTERIIDLVIKNS